MKERNFYIGTAAILIAYYFIFNCIMKLSIVYALPDLVYYGLEILLVLLLAFAALALLRKSPGWSEYGSFHFRWSYLGLLFLSLFLSYIWANLSSLILPSTQNSTEFLAASREASGLTYILVRIVYACLVAPISEELVFRGLLMTALVRYRDYYLDVLISACLFSLMHILQHDWVWTDFIIHMGHALLFCGIFRATRSLYWPIANHILWNSFLTLVGILVFGY